jgi:deoxyribonuclease IV
MQQPVNDLLGAHVSTSGGGCPSGPARAAEIGSRWIQIFTKQPQRWADPVFGDREREAYKAACEEHGVIGTTVHASYLINAASPTEWLYEKSVLSLEAEYRRSATIGAAHVVVHPGSATDGDRKSGLLRNAYAVVHALQAIEADTILCLEGTTGKGNILGATLEELRLMLDMVEEVGGSDIRKRAACCLDTCHLYAAGYDLRERYEEVMAEVEHVIGLAEIRVWHLNDSQGALGSKTDRHAWIGDGEIGTEGFRQLMTDDRWIDTPMLLETPKGDDATASDRRNLELLRSMRG